MRNISLNIYNKFIKNESKSRIILILYIFISILITNSYLDSYFNKFKNRF